MKRSLQLFWRGSIVALLLVVLWTVAYPRLFPQRFQADQQAYQDFVRTNNLAK